MAKQANNKAIDERNRKPREILPAASRTTTGNENTTGNNRPGVTDTQPGKLFKPERTGDPISANTPTRQRRAGCDLVRWIWTKQPSGKTTRSRSDQDPKKLILENHNRIRLEKEKLILE